MIHSSSTQSSSTQSSSVLPNYPLISVVIPTYNRASVIKYSLASALKQSYPTIEIIVVDDASTDNTFDILKRIKDNRIRYIKHVQTLGGGAARNTGTKASKGDFIAFLDSDDIWHKHKLEIQLKAIKHNLNGEKVVSYTQLFPYPKSISDNVDFSDFDRLPLPTRDKKADESLAEYLFCHGGMMQTSTLMLSREFALAVPFRENLKKHQDWDLCLRLEEKGANFLLIKEPLVILNRDPSLNHISSTKNYHLSESWIKACHSSVTYKAWTGFSLKRILPCLLKKKERKFYAQKILISGFLFQMLNLKSLIQLTIQNWSPSFLEH